MMTVGILGVLASIALMAFTANREKGYDAQVISIMKTLLTVSAIDEPEPDVDADGDYDGDPAAGFSSDGQGGNLTFLGPEYAGISIGNKVYWKIENDGNPANGGNDLWQFFLANEAGNNGYYFWIPGSACNADDDGAGQVSDRIVWDNSVGSYRKIASIDVLP
jgi:hypothetical protein